MAELTEYTYLKCPYGRARGYLQAAIAERMKGGDRTMTLRVALGGMELKKDVLVTFAPGVDPMHMEQPWRVRWTPKEPGPYPDFEGELTVRADENYTSSLLELKGEYRPPGGVLGEAFDHVVGSRIAALTGQILLRRIGDEFEARYKEEEALKQTDRGVL